MTKCEQYHSDKIIYSGIDAFALDVMDMVGKVCYPCAYYNKTKKVA